VCRSLEECNANVCVSCECHRFSQRTCGEWYNQWSRHYDITNTALSHSFPFTTLTSHSSLTNHIHLAELIKASSEDITFREKWQTERSMIEGESRYDILEDLIACQYPPYRILRLLCLQSLCGGGIKSSRYDSLRRDVVQTYGWVAGALEYSPGLSFIDYSILITSSISIIVTNICLCWTVWKRRGCFVAVKLFGWILPLPSILCVRPWFSSTPK